MKRSCLFLCLFIFLISCLCVNAQSSIAWVQLGEPQQTHNLSFLVKEDPNDEPYSVLTTKDGVVCRYIPSNYKYGYFYVDDEVIPSDVSDLIFKVTYYDEGRSNLMLEYNASSGNNYKQVIIKKTNTHEWVTATFAVTDASFRNAQNQGGDFRISWDNYISRVEIAFGVFNPNSECVVTPLGGSDYSDLSGKSVAGYQAWFSTGGQYDYWAHWGSDKASSDGTLWPRAGYSRFDVYPDVSDYTQDDLHQTGYQNLGNGDFAQLYDASSRNVINQHFDHMRQYGIDGVAVQRFINPSLRTISYSKGASIQSIRDAAERNNRIFYITYDITSTGLADCWDDLIRFDWVYNVERNYALTQSPSYATMCGHPVVQIWGTGFTGNHPGTAAETIALIEWFKSRGCYVIGGVPTYWRENKNDAKGPSQSQPADQESFSEVYLHYDMLSPWMVGRITADNSSFYTELMREDLVYCKEHNLDYLPVVYPGFSWGTWESGDLNQIARNAGQFMWDRVVAIYNMNLPCAYYAMFDEYDEGTALYKSATDWSMLPTDAYFVTTSADGLWCSSDFYMRLAGAATELLKRRRALTTSVPITYSMGPVYYRNSFEQRTTSYSYTNNVASKSGTFPLDPCFYKPEELSAVKVRSVSCKLDTDKSRSGLYSAHLQGKSSNSASLYIYCFSKQVTLISEALKVSAYSLMSRESDKLNIRVRLDDGTTLQSYVGGNSKEWTEVSILLDSKYVGRSIVGLDLVYEGSSSGTFHAYLDDVLIERVESEYTSISSSSSASIRLYNGRVMCEEAFTIYDMYGRDVTAQNGQLPHGVYLVRTAINTTKILI